MDMQHPERPKRRRIQKACVVEPSGRSREEKPPQGAERYRELADSLPAHVWVVTSDGRLECGNRRWVEYVGRGYEELLGQGWHALIHPSDLPGVLKRWKRAVETATEYEAEYRMRGGDGEYRIFMGRALPMRDGKGSILRWFGVSTDITELREAERERDRALAEATAERVRLYEVFMQAPAANAVMEGPDHVFTVANPLYRELVGVQHLTGRSVRDALPYMAGEGVFELLDGVYASGQPLSTHELLVRLDRDGDGKAEDCFIDFDYQPLKDARGSTFGILVHAVDVTQKVRARQQIAAARAEAERANRAKAEFLASMSHDFRTPLNAIGGYAQLTSDGAYGPATEKQREAMTRICRAGTHLLALIDSILGFARIEAGRIHMKLADVPVTQVLADATSMVELQAADKGLSFGPHRGADGMRVRADPERVVEVLSNLLTNAVKFTDAGSVTIECRADGATVCIDVHDTGRGIPPDRLSAIFEPFVQERSSDDEERLGVGLGLAISRDLARAMGGDVTVESTVARGSTFTLRLPVAAGAPPAAPPRPPPTGSASSSP
jgi:PAS domain S-box-containing protein